MDWSGKIRRGLAVCAVAGACSAVGYGRIIYVDDDGWADGDGSSWENAYRYVQDALTDSRTATEPVEIRVAGGIYKPDRSAAHPDGSGDREAEFSLDDAVSLRGGFAGRGTADPNQRDTAAYATILSGDLAGDDCEVSDPCDRVTEPSRWDNSRHLVRINGSTHTTFEGFTITAGYAFLSPASHDPLRRRAVTDISVFEASGGVMIGCSTVTIRDCLFTNNCGWRGGALNITSGSHAEIEGCTFSGNTATDQGGALYADHVDLRLQRCRFVTNQAMLGTSRERPPYSTATFEQMALLPLILTRP